MSDLLRRSPESIVALHQMDQERISLYVEGLRDRRFIEWLTDPSRSQHATISEIASVEITAAAGGERGRLLEFAKFISDSQPAIRMLADADHDRVLERVWPPTVWLTDHRDLEGYFLRVECLEKVIRLGIGNVHVAAEALLDDVTRIGRRLGVLRILSDRDGVGLAFQKTTLWRSLTAAEGRVQFNFDRYWTTLLQNSCISITAGRSLRTRLHGLETEYNETPDSELVHGKDAVEIVGKALSCFGVKKQATARLLRTSYERDFANDQPVLVEIRAFLSA